MPRTPGSRNRTSPDSFTQALKDAERKLADTINRKTIAEKEVKQCDSEIPRLQGIIRALGGTVALTPGSGNGSVLHVAPGFDDSLELRASNRNEIPDGAGSIPVVVNGSVQPGQEKAPDIDSLPGMEGEYK